MKSHFAGNVHFALTLLSAFVFFVTLGTCLRSSAAFAQENSTAGKASVELTTDPSPAHKGTNVVKVMLTDQTGRPIAGATVTVTFYMPAMPSMGMAAMRTVVKAIDKGSGMYEGKGDLASGGTWQVTITARENGQIIANRKLTTKATGGM